MKRKLLFTGFFLWLVLPSVSLEAQELYTTRVIDGVTILMSNGEEVGLIGVDTPGTQAYGLEAQQFLWKLAEGARVRLEFDQQRRDQYGRLLAYIYMVDEPSGLLLNEEVIRNGYGHAATTYAFKYLERFRRAEREAREKARGLWASERAKATTEAPTKTLEAPAPSEDKDVYVKGYYRKDGTYVRPHYRSRPSKK